MTKKLTSLALALVLCLSLCVPAFAADQADSESNANVRVVNRSSNISDSTIAEIANDVGARMVYDDGTVIPIDSIVTIEDVGLQSNRAADGNITNAYQVRSVSHVISDTDRKDLEDVEATVTLTMVWIDGPGVDNSIDTLKGSVTVTKGAIESSEVLYRNTLIAGWSASINLGKRTSWSESINKKVQCPQASYSVRFVDAFWELNVGVTATVFD